MGVDQCAKGANGYRPYPSTTAVMADPVHLQIAAHHPENVTFRI